LVPYNGEYIQRHIEEVVFEDIPTSIVQLASLLSTGIAAGALIITARQFQKNNKAQRESDRARELQIIEQAFNQIVELERFFHEQEAGPNETRILYEEWARLYFQRIDWLAFMIVHNWIQDPDIMNFFRDKFRQWEIMYLRDVPEQTRNDPEALSSLKTLFERYRKDKEEKKGEDDDDNNSHKPKES
jgi:hypothetical protein